MPRDKLIMFDFDGVIADSLEDQSRAFVDTLRSHGLDELATRSTFLDFTETNWFEALAEADVPESVVAAIEDAFAAAPSPDLFPEMADSHRAPGRGPSGRRHHLEPHRRRGGHPRGERRLRRRGGHRRRRGAEQDTQDPSVRERFGESLPAWYVCDTVGDVHEARDAGAVTVGVAWGWHGEERLLRAEPDQMAQRPADLLDLF